MTVNFRFRDWLISRQRYWGTPIPMLYCESDGMVAGARRSVAGRAAARRRVHRPRLAARQRRRRSSTRRARSAAARRKRDPDTMDTFVDSSWYYVRYLDPHNGDAAVRQSEGLGVDARRSVHRRRGACRDASALRALLLQVHGRRGLHQRRRRAVHAAVQPGHAAAQRREDVEEPRQRGRHRRDRRDATASMRCACSCSRPRRPKTRSSGPTRASSAACASFSACGARANRSSPRPARRRSTACRACAGDAQRALVRALHLALKSAQRRNGDAPLPLQRHDGAARRAGEPAHRRRARSRARARSGRALHDPRAAARARAVRAAHRGRAVAAHGHTRPRSTSSAGSKPIRRRSRSTRSRSSSRSTAKCAAACRRAPGVGEDDVVRAGDGRERRARAHRRQDGAQAHLRPRQAAEHRRRVSIAVGPDDALIVVDVQHDFLPGGALAVADRRPHLRADRRARAALRARVRDARLAPARSLVVRAVRRPVAGALRGRNARRGVRCAARPGEGRHA